MFDNNDTKKLIRDIVAIEDDCTIASAYNLRTGTVRLVRIAFRNNWESFCQRMGLMDDTIPTDACTEWMKTPSSYQEITAFINKREVEKDVESVAKTGPII